jgi:hypothetical protein
VNIVLIVEGDSDKRALRPFLQRWLNGKTSQTVAIDVVNVKGFGNYFNKCPSKATLHLKNPNVAVIGLLDLHGPDYPNHCKTSDKQCTHLRQDMQQKVGSDRFRQHFAIHELEAWLLSDPTIFPPDVEKALAKKVTNPESLQAKDLPNKLLERLYLEKMRRDYKKRVHGPALFTKLDPTLAAKKCPALAALLDDLLTFATSAA